MIPNGVLIRIPILLEHGVAIVLGSKWDNTRDHWRYRCYWATTGRCEWIPDYTLQVVA